jgi:DNA-binding NarL/FixJ family response regulator
MERNTQTGDDGVERGSVIGSLDRWRNSVYGRADSLTGDDMGELELLDEGRLRRVLVVDGNLLTREGVADILRSRRYVVSATNYVDAARAAVAFRPDVSLLNASTVPLARMVRELGGVIVAFGVSNEPQKVLGVVELQIAAFLLESEPIARLCQLIDSANTSDPQCPQEVVPMLMRKLAATDRESSARSLTPREVEVLRLLQSGFANKEIARALGISTRTVKNHLHTVYDKLNVHTRGEASARFRMPDAAQPA